MPKGSEQVHPFRQIPIPGEKVDPYRPIPVPVNVVLDDKAESLGWGLQPSGDVQLAKAIKKTTVLTNDLQKNLSQIPTLVSWREYSNNSGVVGIYYTNQWGAHVTYGGIRDKFLQLGGTSSYLGFPMADESGNGQNNRWSNFNGGIIWWDGLVAYTEVSVNPVTRRHARGRYVSLDITGLTPGGRFDVYRIGMFNNDTDWKQAGHNYAGPDGSYFGFDVDELYTIEDPGKDRATAWKVVDVETGRHNNPVR